MANNKTKDQWFDKELDKIAKLPRGNEIISLMGSPEYGIHYSDFESKEELNKLVSKMLRDIIKNNPDGFTRDERRSIRKDFPYKPDKNPLDISKMYKNGELKRGQELSKEEREELAENYDLSDEQFDIYMNEAMTSYDNAHKDVPQRALTKEEILDFPIGQSPEKNPKFNEWLDKNDLTPQQGKALIGNHWKNYAKQYQAGTPQRIEAQRRFYSAVVNSDIPTAQKIYDQYKDDPVFNAYARDVYKEKPGFFKHTIQKGMEMVAPSAVHRYNEDIKNGTDYTFGDIAKGSLIDAGQVLAGGAASKGLGILTNKIGAQTLRGLAGQKALEFIGDLGIGFGTEAGRQFLNGEDFDTDKMIGAGLGQAGTSYLLDKITGGFGKLHVGGAKDVSRREKARAERDADYDYKWDNAKAIDELERGLKNPTDGNVTLMGDRYAPDKEKNMLEAKERVKELEKKAADEEKYGTSDDNFEKMFINNDGDGLVIDEVTVHKTSPKTKKELSNARKSASSRNNATKAKLEKILKEKKEAQAESVETLKKKYLNNEKVTEAEQARINALKGSWTTEANRANHSAPMRTLLTDVGNRKVYSSKASSVVPDSAIKLLVDDDDELKIEEDLSERDARWANGGATLEEKMTPEYSDFLLKFQRPATGSLIQTYHQ